MAEALTFRKISTGFPQFSCPPTTALFQLTVAADDLKKVTRLAYGQVAEAGMSERVGHISLSPHSPGRRPYSKWLAAQIDREVR